MKDKLKIGLFFAVAFISIIQVAAALTMTLRPDGQGVYSEWTNVGCGSGSSEWQCVDEVSVNTSDYLYTSSKTKKETFTFSNTGPANMTINNLTIYYYAKRYSSSRYKVQPLIKINGNNYLGSIKNLGSSYAYVSETYNTNPKTGNPWTKSEVDALEAGMKSYKSTYGGYVAQVYVVVDYTIPDSCSDTDNGNYKDVFGTASGYYNNNPYSDDDYCVDSGTVMEYYCSGNYEQSQQQSCGTDGYTSSEYCLGNLVYKNYTDYFCSVGACNSNVTQELQQNCDSYDGYGSNYCNGSAVYRDYYNYYCSGGSCLYFTTPELVESCDYGCTDGECNPIPDSCSDTDGGWVSTIQGTVSGYLSEQYYNSTDYCFNSTVVVEFYCVGNYSYNSTMGCDPYLNQTCVNGACV